jgi:hypothetical protein
MAGSDDGRHQSVGSICFFSLTLIVRAQGLTQRF